MARTTPTRFRGKKNDSEPRVNKLTEEEYKEEADYLLKSSLPLLLRKRGVPSSPEEIQQLVDKLRLNTPSDVFEETIARLNEEITAPEYKREESEHFGGEGGGSLELLIRELLGFSSEAGHHIVSSQ